MFLRTRDFVKVIRKVLKDFDRRMLADIIAYYVFESMDKPKSEIILNLSVLRVGVK